MANNTHDLGNRKHVFIDWDLIEPGYGVSWSGEKPVSREMPIGVRLAVHQPRIDPEPMVSPDRPWESSINAYATLFEDEGRFRLYYEPHYMGEGEEYGSYKAMLAYAESTDGVNWVKPTIGTVRFQGSMDNNLVYGLELSKGRGAHGATVFKDPSAPPEERYKMVHAGRDENNTRFVHGAVSPDGLRWKAMEEPLISDYMSDTQTVARYDPEKGRYVGYFRGWAADSSGLHGRRTIAYAESDRFDRWPVPEQLVAPDMHDSPDTDIYTNAYTRWPDADAHLMFPTFYQRRLDTLEVHMMTSRDGLHWERPTRLPVVPGGEPASDSEGGYYAGCGLVSLQPGEWSLPIFPTWQTHNQSHFAAGPPPPHRGYLCRAVWREDGFTSLEAETEGQCTTVPITFSGGRLQVNAWTRFGGEIRVELADASGESMGSSSPLARADASFAEPVAGRTFDECDPISDDALNSTVTWNGESDLSAWAGKTVRLRLRMRRARLYAIRFA